MPDNFAASPNKLRVLIAGHLPPPIGGMATYYKILVNSKLSEYIDYCFVQTSSQKRVLASSGRATFKNLISAFRDCVRFTKALVSYRPQIVHIGTAFGLSFLKHSYCVLIAHLLGKRVLLHPHCSLPALYNDRSKQWQWFFRQVIHWTDGIIALSQEWLQLKSIVPGCKVFYLPNPVNVEDYHPALENHQSEIHNKGPLSILYLGYLGKAKGTFDLIEAANIIRARGIEMVFELVGSELTPGELEFLRKKVKQLILEGYVKLNNPAHGADKLAYFRNAEIFVYPSYNEGVPMAVLEAMASGLPIVGSRVGGLPDLIKDNGVLFEPGQPEQLADILCGLANEPALRFSMQKISFQMVSEKYSVHLHISNLVDIYKKISWAAPA